MLNVLICDDEAIGRHLIRRAASKAFNCRIIEATDGLEALDALQTESIDVVVMDLEMPVLGGLQVLRAMRASHALDTIPVVIISAKNETSTVLEAVKLHVEDIIAKPIDLEALITRFVRLGRVIGERQTNTRRRTTGSLGPDATALLADGDAEYRHFFSGIVGSRCVLSDADSGSRALRACLKTPPDVLFIGTELGLMGAPELVERVRAIRSKAVRIVAIPLKSEGQAARDSGLFDDVLIRTYDSSKFEAEIARLLRPLAPFEILSEQLPDIRTRLLRAVEQAFGRMLKTDVEPMAAPAPSGQARAVAEIAITTPTFIVTLRIRFDIPTGRRLAAAFLESDASDLSDDDVASVGGELANVLAGRLHAMLEERRVESALGLPVLGTEPPSGADSEPANEEAFDQHFRAVNQDITFQLDLTVEATAATPVATVDEESGAAMLRADT